jgi:GATA zinc finger/KIX domain
MLVTFHTRKLWSEHEFSEHRLDRFLKCHDCSEEFMDEDEFIEHLKDSHRNRASGSQLLAIISAAKTSVPTAIDSQKCPLCFQDGWKSQRNFAAHVGRHMEEIALACLPKDAEGEDESTDGEDKLQDQAVHDQQEGEDQIERDCANCRTRVTPKWRRGPSGNLDLCNSCGLRWMKQARSVGSKARSRTSSDTELVNPASHEAYHVPSGVPSSDDEEGFAIKCICIYTDDDGKTVYCQKCETWQHIECYYPEVPVPELHLCSDCRPRELDRKRANEWQMRFRVQSDSGGRNSRQHATMTNKTELETLPILDIEPAARSQYGTLQPHIITSLQQQGPFTGWQATITVEQRTMQVNLLIDKLRLIKPVIELPRIEQVAASFEQKAFVQSKSKDAYVAMCKAALATSSSHRSFPSFQELVRKAM